MYKTNFEFWKDCLQYIYLNINIVINNFRTVNISIYGIYVISVKILKFDFDNDNSD